MTIAFALSWQYSNLILEINSALLCDSDGLLCAFVECLQVGNSLSTQYGAIQLFYQLSQFPQSRSKMKNSNAIEL